MRTIYPYDAFEIVRMMQAVRIESPTYAYTENDPEFVENNLMDLITAGLIVGVIEPDKGVMIGGIGNSWYSRRREAHEQLLYVSPPHRGGLLAVRLIKAFEVVCREAGAEVIHAGASTGLSEDRTVNLYSRLGYSIGSPTLTKGLI
jgi:GNAT superfamily N-acetyltransferase